MISWLMISVAVAAILFVIYVYCCAQKIFAINADINWALENLHAPDDAFGKSERLAPVWKDFSGTLTETPDGIFSTMSASEFFSAQNLTRGMNMSFWQAYGGIFTGLGIFGTFWGLTLGLYGMDMSGDIDTLKAGIANLLTGVETAFVTSLVGILGALIYSGIHHCLMKNFQANILRLSDKLDEIFPRRPAEDWLAKSFAEQQIHTQEFQKFANAVEDFGTDEVSALGKIFAEQQAQTVALQKLGDVVENFGTDEINTLGKIFAEQQAQTAALQKLGDSLKNFGTAGGEVIGEVFAQKVGTQLETFAATLDKFSASVAEKIAKSQQVSDDMNQKLLGTLDDLSNILKQQAKISVAQNQVTAQKFSDTANRLQEILINIADDNHAQISEAVKAFREIVDRHNETTEKTFTRIQQLLDGSEIFLRAVDEAGHSLETAADTVSRTNRQLLANLPALSVQIKNLLDADQITSENISALSTHIIILVQNFNGIADEFERSANVIKDSLEHYNSVTNDGLKEKLHDFDTTMRQAVGHLHATIEDLNEFLDDFKPNQRR